MTFERVVEAIEEAEKSKAPIGPVSDMVQGGLSLEAAYGIMESLVERRRQRGDEIAGYKVGFTNTAVREKMGLPDSTYGYIMDSMVLTSGSRINLKDLIAPKIECEICFKLKKDLYGKGIPVEKILDATLGVAASFEICDSRIKDWRCPYPDFFADNGFSARVVLAEGWRDVSKCDLLGEEVVLFQGGTEKARGRGEMAMGHPARAVSWLAGKLHERGRGLLSGQIVMTGTLTAIQPVVGPSSCRAQFSTLGEVRVDFV